MLTCLISKKINTSVVRINMYHRLWDNMLDYIIHLNNACFELSGISNPTSKQ